MQPEEQQSEIISSMEPEPPKPNRKIWGYVFLVLIFAVAVALVYHFQYGGTYFGIIDSYEDCAAAGYPIMESQPPKCRTPDGRSFIEEIDRMPAFDPTADWQTYRNEEFGFEFRYPNQLGQLNDEGKNAYLLNTFEFSGEAQSVNYLYINTFTDKSVSDWQTAIQNSLNNNEPIGDPAFLPYSLSVKNLLTSKAVGYDCAADLGEYLSKQNNESCQIVSINGINAFKIVATGPFQSEVSELKYLFYINETWFDFSKRFWVYSKDNPNKQLYTFEQLNSILQGKTSNATIQAEVDIFNQILSTFRFVESEICIQVITPARNPQTGEVRDFPTPCDVPENWEPVIR